MVEPITRDSPTIPSYRDIAENCRRMATSSRRPEPLLERARAFQAAALELEQSEQKRRADEASPL